MGGFDRRTGAVSLLRASTCLFRVPTAVCHPLTWCPIHACRQKRLLALNEDVFTSPNLWVRQLFETRSHAFVSSVPPHTRRVLGYTWYACSSAADWCLQPIFVLPISILQDVVYTRALANFYCAQKSIFLYIHIDFDIILSLFASLAATRH